MVRAVGGNSGGRAAIRRIELPLSYEASDTAVCPLEFSTLESSFVLDSHPVWQVHECGGAILTLLDYE